MHAERKRKSNRVPRKVTSMPDIQRAGILANARDLVEFARRKDDMQMLRQKTPTNEKAGTRIERNLVIRVVLVLEFPSIERCRWKCVESLKSYE